MHGRISLILLVGAARFELTTPCAQGSFRRFAESACFLMLMFQADAASLLRLVESLGIWRLWHPHLYLQRLRTSAVLQSPLPAIGTKGDRSRPRFKVPTSACPFKLRTTAWISYSCHSRLSIFPIRGAGQPARSRTHLLFPHATVYLRVPPMVWIFLPCGIVCGWPIRPERRCSPGPAEHLHPINCVTTCSSPSSGLLTLQVLACPPCHPGPPPEALSTTGDPDARLAGSRTMF